MCVIMTRYQMSLFFEQLAVNWRKIISEYEIKGFKCLQILLSHFYFFLDNESSVVVLISGNPLIFKRAII